MLSMSNTMYIELLILLAFVACSIIIVVSIRKLISQQLETMHMIEGYEHQMKVMNERLYEIDCDTYDLAQRCARGGINELRDN